MLKYELALNTIATMFNFIFNEFAMVIYKTKISILQCLLRIDGSILQLPGVFLTSSCVVPESSGFQSNAASSSLFVHVELGTRTALVKLIALSQHSTDLHTIGGSRRHWRLFSYIDPYTVMSNQFRLQLLTIKLLL